MQIKSIANWHSENAIIASHTCFIFLVRYMSNILCFRIRCCGNNECQCDTMYVYYSWLYKQYTFVIFQFVSETAAATLVSSNL